MPQTIDNMLATWSNSGTTYTGLKLSVTDTASAAGSLLMDLQVGGGSRGNIKKTGDAFLRGTAIQFGVNNNETAGVGSYVGSNGLTGLSPGASISWRSIAASGGEDTFVTRRAAASLRLGNSDNASPVAQTLGVQSVTGVADTAGANFTIAGSQGTGTGAGGSIVFQVAPAGTTGTAQNALVNVLAINSNEAVSLRPSSTSGGLLTAGDNGFRTLQFLGVSYGNNGVGAVRDGVGFATRAANGYHWVSDTNSAAGSVDLSLVRDAADTLALRRGANAQAFRVYNTTDGTNFERGFIRWSGNVLQIATEAGGTGTLRPVAVIAGPNLDFGASNGTQWRINSSGHFLSLLDNTYDIGASGATRPRSIYAGTSVAINGATLSPLGGANRLAYGSSISATNVYTYFNPDAGTPAVGFRSGWGIGWSSSTINPVDNPPDTLLMRVDAGIAGVRGSSISNGAALSFIEQTAPAAPATNGVYIYAEDNGSGKTRLMARFATGAAVQIAIEP